jgi:drug/metabolite transporter (DMT)-like permease
MNRTHLKGSAMILLCAILWGVAFSAQDLAARHIGTFTIGALRSVIGVGALTVAILAADKLRGNGRFLFSRKKSPLTRREFFGGMACGTALTVASALQQAGLATSGASKASFITALYVVLVPIAGAILFRRRIGLRLWCADLIALVGLAMITLGDDLTLATGDILLLCGAFCFCTQILVVDHFLPGADGIRLSAVQFATVAVLNAILALIFEDISLAAIGAAILPLVYLGVMSSGCAYTLQILGQQYCPPTPAAILMSTESLFGVIAAALILDQRLSLRGYLGCAVMFVAIILSQLPDRKQK